MQRTREWPDGVRNKGLILHFTRGIGALSVLVGAFVVAGWVADVEALRSLIPGYPQMKMNTGLAFILTGASLVLSVSRVRGARLTGRVLAGLVTIIALLTLCEYLLRLDLDALAVRAKLPGSKMIPASHALRCALSSLPNRRSRNPIECLHSAR